MAFSVLNSLSFVFLVAGFTLLVTGLALARRAKRYRRGMQTLLKLGAKQLPPLDIPAAAWPVLAAAGWQHLSLSGDWFGYAVQTECGAGGAQALGVPTPEAANVMVFHIDSGDDVALTLRLTHRVNRGEGRLLADPLAEVLVLLMDSSLRTRTEAISVALAQRGHLSLYLQHDMRNLAQWVGWVCADFEACLDAPALHAAARRLQENAPIARERAQRLIAALGKTPVNDLPAAVDMRIAITTAAQLAGMEVNLSGQATAWLTADVLARVLDNLFSNLAPHWREAPLIKPTVQLRQVAASGTALEVAEIDFFSPWPTSDVPMAPEKLFEPFASGRPGGLGLGLYQARKSLREAGGELRATAVDGGVNFLLRMPAGAA
jgi:hypothetical protein